MWKCEHCGSVFEEGNRVFDEDVGYLYCCPSCGDDDIATVYECEVCGEYAEDTTHDACPECYEKMKNRISGIIKYMTEAEYQLFVACVDEG